MELSHDCSTLKANGCSHLQENANVADTSRCPICMKINRRKVLIECDTCSTWHHLSCVGLTKKQAAIIPKWVCRACLAQNEQCVEPEHTIGASTPDTLATDCLHQGWRRQSGTVVRLPTRIRGMTAQIMSNLIKDALSLNTEESWVRLLLFPKICFATHIERSSSQRAQRNNASHMKESLCRYTSTPLEQLIASLAKPYEASRAADVPTNSAVALARRGNYGKAMKRLCYNGLAPVNETVREKLLNLHPQNGIYRLQSDTCLDAGFQVNSLIVDCSLVRAAIFSFPSTSASGCLGLRPEHLQDLLTSDLSGSFLQRITSLVNTLLGGGGHESVARYLCGANLIALVKEPDGVRPIAVGETLRRLCSKCACRKLSTVFLSVLQPTQLGVATKNGVDSIIHIVRDEHTRRRDKDDWVWAKVDLRNAFNSISRHAIFSVIQRSVPQLMSWLRYCYSEPSLLRFGNLEPLRSCQGVQQGDPLGPSLFSLAIHDCITSVGCLHGIHLNRWYLDDGIIGGHPTAVADALAYLEREFALLRLDLNWQKTEIIGSAVALQTFSEACASQPILNESKNFCLLGTPIGCQDFVNDQLMRVNLPKLRSQIDLITTIPDTQVAYLLLRHCASAPKINHLMRTIDPDYGNTFYKSFDDSTISAFSEMTSVQLNPQIRTQITLPLRLGGFGIRETVKHAPCAYIASVQRVCAEWGLSVNTFPGLSDFIERLSSLHESPPIMQSDSQHKLSMLLDNKVHEQMLTDVHHFNRARLLAVSRPHASSWLRVVPNKALGMDIPPSQFCALTRFWLGAPLFSPGDRCGRCFLPADSVGLHALTCQYGGYPGLRHNGIRDVVFHAAQSAGMHVALEVRNLIPDLRERPADVLIHGDPPRAVDFAVTHPQQSAYIANASITPGYAATMYAVNVKERKYRARMESAGYQFIPAVVETYGGWNDQGERLMRSIARQISATTGIEYHKTVDHLFQRASLALMRGNARAILASLNGRNHPLSDAPQTIMETPKRRMFNTEPYNDIAGILTRLSSVESESCGVPLQALDAPTESAANTAKETSQVDAGGEDVASLDTSRSWRN